MAITKLVITGNTTAVGISTTPITVSLEHKAESTSVASVGNITATNVQRLVGLSYPKSMPPHLRSMQF